MLKFIEMVIIVKQYLTHPLYNIEHTIQILIIETAFCIKLSKQVFELHVFSKICFYIHLNITNDKLKIG